MPHVCAWKFVAEKIAARAMVVAGLTPANAVRGRRAQGRVGESPGFQVFPRQEGAWQYQRWLR